MGLPTGVTLAMVWAVLLPVAVVTVALRAAPFLFRRLLRGSPLLEFLGVIMPVSVMTVLVVYSIAGATDAPGGVVASLIATVVTLGLHAYRRSLALSIFTGTFLYVVLVNWVF